VAGIGHLRVVDSDTVDLSNLNRQILHWDEDVDKRKAESALGKLQRMNPSITVEASSEHIVEDNVRALVGNANAIVDCMDNFPTRYLLNQVAIERRIPLFHAAVYGMEARISTIVPGETACLRCLFPSAPPPETFPVVGAAPGLGATIQAMEVIKHFSGHGSLLKNRMLVFDGEASRFIDLTLQRDPNCPDCGHL
jgi:adenylyltransferase/sulfurtransferase